MDTINQHEAQCSNKCPFYGHCQTIYCTIFQYYQQSRPKLSQHQVHETQDTYIISLSPCIEMLALKAWAINLGRKCHFPEEFFTQNKKGK